MLDSGLWPSGLPWPHPGIGREVAFLSIVLVFSVLSSALGIGGFALLPLFVWHYGAKAGVTVITLYFLFQNVSKLVLLWRHVDFAVAWKLVAWAAPGAIAGGALLVVIPAQHFQRILGAGILLLVLVPRVLPNPRRPSATMRRAGFASFGIAYGVVSGVLGSGNVLKGPLLTSIGVLKERYIGTYALTSLALNVPKLVVYHEGGIASSQLLARSWPLLVVSLTGTYIGKRVLRHIPDAVFERVTTITFVISALLMILLPT